MMSFIDVQDHERESYMYCIVESSDAKMLTVREEGGRKEGSERFAGGPLKAVIYLLG